MQHIALNELWTLVVALLTIGLGTAVIARVPVLARYSIPPAVVGGFLVAVLLLVLQTLGWRLELRHADAQRAAAGVLHHAGPERAPERTARRRRGGGAGVAGHRAAGGRAERRRRGRGLGLRRAGIAGRVPGQRSLSRRPRHHRGLGRAGAGRQRQERLRRGHGLRHARPGGRRRARQRGRDPAAAAQRARCPAAGRPMRRCMAR